MRNIESLSPTTRPLPTSGRLNQDEFDLFLELDVQKFLRTTPPIMGMFSPEKELEKIRNLKGIQKKEALTIFKMNLARQREALASCRIFIEKCIEFNHDVPREKLTQLVDLFSAYYGFDEKQSQIAQQLIDGYYLNRQKILALREMFPDDIELVDALVGVHLSTSALKATAGPMSIDIYADAFDMTRIASRRSSSVVEPYPYKGFASHTFQKDPIHFIVVNKSKYDIAIKQHEYEHTKNKLFRKIFDQQTDNYESSLLL